MHSPQRFRSLPLTRAAFATLNVAAPAIIPTVVNAAPASMSASDATLYEAAESSTPAPRDMKAAMARCRRLAVSPRIAPTSAPDAATTPHEKAHTAPMIASGITSLLVVLIDGNAGQRQQGKPQVSPSSGWEPAARARSVHCRVRHNGEKDVDRAVSGASDQPSSA